LGEAYSTTGFGALAAFASLGKEARPLASHILRVTLSRAISLPQIQPSVAVWLQPSSIALGALAWKTTPFCMPAAGLHLQVPSNSVNGQDAAIRLQLLGQWTINLMGPVVRQELLAPARTCTHWQRGHHFVSCCAEAPICMHAALA
jgi:hypothetical protein